MASEEDVAACFDLFDAGSTGSIDGKEAIGKAYRALGYAPSEEELSEILEGKESVDLERFKSLAANLGVPEQDEVLEAFSTFDQNSNGYIAISDLKHLMSSLGEGLDPKQIEAMATLCEPDDEGQVNIRHFVSKIMTQ